MTDISTPGSLLDLPTADLLERFAAAKLTPGAGSAAALLGAVAGSLVQAAARYAIKRRPRESDAPFRERATVLLAEARGRSDRLGQAVEEDAAAFTQYWESRSAEALERATDVPLAIARECVALAEIGLELYERGHRNARGEASTAVLSALAGAEAALHTAWLNLQPAGDAPWVEGRREEIHGLRGQFLPLRQRIERVLDAEEPA
jgi:glutamate formiminotransferase/formiminotetrahydrofolate cyclodeaminase